MPENSLFSPIDLGPLKLSNRIVIPPMALAAAWDDGQVSSIQLDYYSLRARRYTVEPALESERKIGPGLVIVEHSYVNKNGKAHRGQMGIDCDEMIAGLSSLAELIHREGAAAGIQISHAGARGMKQVKAPSAINLPFLSQPLADEKADVQGCFPEQLSKDEIDNLIEDFARAARRAREAGFDLVEIHGAHGYLINQFYSPLTNKRIDKYGGCLQARLGFALDVIAAVRQSVGSDFPIFFRWGADDRMPGGSTIRESCRVVPWLVQAGVDCLDLSGGICGYLKKGREGFFLYMADAIRPLVKVPVLVAGGITTPEFAARAIAQGRLDLVGVGRAMLSDPGWCIKAWNYLAGQTSFQSSRHSEMQGPSGSI